MTPKLKAKELYFKYTDALNIRDLQTTANPFAKQCALIAVNNIILANPHSNPFNTDVYSTMGYWLEVKQEIELL